MVKFVILNAALMAVGDHVRMNVCRANLIVLKKLVFPIAIHLSGLFYSFFKAFYFPHFFLQFYAK